MNGDFSSLMSFAAFFRNIFFDKVPRYMDALRSIQHAILDVICEEKSSKVNNEIP